MSDAWKQWEGETVDGRYPLRRFLGGSDHSAVFVTEYGPAQKKAALKFVEAHSATAQLQLSRWERSAKLSHPHLIQLINGGRCQLGRVSMLYVVSEFADENLAQIVPNRPLTPAETEYMLRSVLEVLAYLHSQGLVHTRLKPGNIMSVGEQLKVSSDGICNQGDRSLGNPGPTVYDPPEATASGFSKAGDVWSLGITLVEVLTQRPSPGDGIRQGDPLLPDSVPAPFMEIARQCLRLDPQRRWTVPDIAARLLPSAPPAKRRDTSRYLIPAGAGAVVLAVLAGGAMLLNQQREHTPNAASTKAPNNVQRPDAPPAATPKSENVSPSSQPPASPPSAPRAEKAPDKTPDLANKAPGDAQPTNLPPPKKTGNDSIPGSVAEKVLPPVSQEARNTITGKVRVGVRVSVDPSGKVTEARIDSPGPSHYFANLARQSSRRWKFNAPQVDGQAVESEWELRYQFGRESTDVHPTQVSPGTKSANR